MRKQPSSPPPQVTPKRDDTIITQVREYELITPLFGGGVTPNEADPVTPIRGTEIRGHLRFWWRACRGGKVEFNGDLAKMKKAEGELWGTAAKKSDQTKKEEVKSKQEKDQTVQISVNMASASKAELNSLPPYAAFPLQPLSRESKEKAVRSNVSFQLTISFPADQQKEVEAALWAWETFGGIGARTRRGFGALHLLKVNGATNQDLFPSNVQEAKKWVQQQLGEYVTESTWPENIPHLSRKAPLKITYPSTNGQVVWEYLIRRLSGFRQAPVGRTKGSSNWPEPKNIRRIMGQKTNLVPQHPQKFPRAAFGLPIVFHFKDGDIEDTTLQGAEDGYDRLASPLILRPIVCKDGKAIGLALLLEGPRIPPGGIVLVESETKKRHKVETTLKLDEAAKITPLSGQTDVLQAFLDYL